jgi:hypothetical protein
MSVFELAQAEKEARRPRRTISRALNSPKDRRGCLLNIDDLADYLFTRIFRVNKETFHYILNLISPLLTKSEVHSKCRGLISPKIMLLATLRYLAGGLPDDICLTFNIGIGSFWGEKGVFWLTLYALDSIPDFDIGLPLGDAVAMKRLADEYAAIVPDTEEEFWGCVMAIDGWVCETKKPTMKETSNIRSYRNRKGIWGFTVLAGCDAKGKFLMFSCNGSGSANDILAWRWSSMKQNIISPMNGTLPSKLPPQYFFIGDEAFVCENQLLVPWPGRGIGSNKDSFNYHLSARRQVIERAFGMLTRRWGIFHRPLQCQLWKWTLVASVAAKLHNVCLDRNVPNVRRYDKNVVCGDVWNVYLNDSNREEGDRSNAHAGKRRADITAALHNQRILRPSHAMHNSRAMS